MDDNIEKMLKEVFGNGINKKEPSDASSPASVATSQATLGSSDTKVDQDYVNQYTAFLQQILKRAKNNNDSTVNNGVNSPAADILGETVNLLNSVSQLSSQNTDILSEVEKLLNSKADQGQEQGQEQGQTVEKEEEKSATTATPNANSSCGDANVCIENVNNEGITTDTTIYAIDGTGKDRVIVENIISK